MANRRAIKGALRNFVETYTSRYSDFGGYWLFGFIVDNLQRLNIDLLNPAHDNVATPTERAAILIAVTKFREQIERAQLNMSYIREARLVITKSQDAEVGFVNGHSCRGFQLKFYASALSDHGQQYEYVKSVFAAPHDPSVELQSTRAKVDNSWPADNWTPR